MLSKFSVKRPITILMIIFIVILIGFVSLTKLPIDLLPKIEMPIAIVQTSYSGVGPQEIEKLVTRPLEESLSTVDNIESISSMSTEGSSMVILQFDFGTDMDFASLKMREKIDVVKGYLPEDATDPMVFKFDPNAMPIMALSISSSGDIATTGHIAEDIVKPRLERIEGAASVDIIGGLVKEIQVKLLGEKVQGYGISSDYIAQILMSENLNLPGGSVNKGKNELTVRTIGEFQSLEEIRNLNISLPNGGTVRLKDIADVNFVNKKKTTISRLNNKDTLQLSIMKQSGVNTVNVSKEINKEIDQLRKDYPNLQIDTVFDQAEFINLAIQGVANNAVVGGCLAVLILFLFLRSIKSTIIIGLSIPISIITTFILLYFTDITLNMMTLGGLALGIGMLVDNSIVVLENIYRHRSEGLGIKESAVVGANEVAVAVTASTLTTIAVFLPIVFVQGITSTIFKELAMTVTLSLISSLVVSLTLIPMMSSKLLTINKKLITREENIKENKVRKIYKRILGWGLKHRFITVAICVFIFIISITSMASMGAAFFPPTDEGQIDVSVSLPAGSELSDTDNTAKEIENLISSIPEIKYVSSSIGSAGTYSFGGSTGNSASLTVMLKSRDEREKSTFEVADTIRNIVKDIPGAEINVSVSSTMSMGGLGGNGLSISIAGDDIDILNTISEDFEDLIAKVEGTREITSSISEGIPEVQVLINRNRASQYGLTSAQIANGVKSSISGKAATKFKYEGDEIDVIIRGDDIYNQSISSLEMTPITTPLGTTVPLSQVADVKISKGPISINREDQTRVVSVSCDVFNRDVQTVANEVSLLLDDYEMPRGYSYNFGGETELINDAFKDLALALIMAVILVYMILAAQFESLIQPLSIMFTVPLALSGGALGLYLTGTILSVPALIGFIILVGIVVNNGIVLVDYINTRRKKDKDRIEAIKNAGAVRLRPIMMTALTTILALVPLSLGIGEGAELEQPLAIVVIGGLLLSTILTLVFIPVMYTIFDDISRFFRKKSLKGDDAEWKSKQAKKVQ